MSRIVPGNLYYRPSAHVRIAGWTCALFTAITAAAAIFGQKLGPDTSVGVPIAATIWSLSDLLTAFFLMIRCYVSGRLAFGIIAVAYAISGFLTWPYFVTYMILVRTPAPPVDRQQIPAALYLIWHFTFALMILGAYLFENSGRRTLQRTHVKRAVVWLTIAAVAISTIVATATIVFSNALPHLVISGIFQPAYSAVGMPIAIALCAAGCALLVHRGNKRGSITLWLTVALYTSLLDALLNVVSPIRSSYAWDAGKLMTVCSSCMLMAFLLIENVRLYLMTTKTERVRTERGAARMRALWQISTSESLSESAYVQMILEVATAHVRSGYEALGILSHLENDRIVVDACAVDGSSNALASAAALSAPGTSFPLTSDVHSLIYQSGRTCYWHRTNEPTLLLWGTRGLHSIIGAPIPIGNQTHFVTFALIDPVIEEPFDDSDVAFVDVVASNIGHRFHQRSQLDKIKYQIEHDALTGLYNRTQFNRYGRLGAADGSLFGIIAINLDAFRAVNAQAGQMIGDEVLLEIANGLAHLDEGDLVARLGGDDFAVLLRSNGAVRTIAQRIEAYERVFQHPFHTGDRDGKIFLNVTASLGAARFTSGKSAFDETLANANVALDASKAAGGNCSTVFGPQLEYLTIERSLERKEIVAALDDDQFFLEYQPTVDMRSRRIGGCEALIRWHHPVRGDLPPAAFLAGIRRANLLGEMTTWILQRIVRDLSRAVLPDDIRCYFNVPATVLESDIFVNQIAVTLSNESDLCHRLGLEITESDMMNKMEHTIETLKRLRGFGLRIAIDDFGTGYSSLSYLKRLPIDIVKLDKSFIDGLPDDANDMALATMFLSLTKQLGLISVAEGIETDEQAAWLLEQGCAVGQGFLFARPLAFDDFCARIRVQNGVHVTLGTGEERG